MRLRSIKTPSGSAHFLDEPWTLAAAHSVEPLNPIWDTIARADLKNFAACRVETFGA